MKHSRSLSVDVCKWVSDRSVEHARLLQGFEAAFTVCTGSCTSEAVARRANAPRFLPRRPIMALLGIGCVFGVCFSKTLTARAKGRVVGLSSPIQSMAYRVGE